MRFEGTEAYVATDDLKIAVNAAITLERPLLVKGEPGTGKTVLALEIAQALGAPLIEWHVKSTTKALQGLYEYDAVSRLRDLQCQHGLAGTGLALDQQGPLQRDRRIDRDFEVVGRHIVLGAFKTHGIPRVFGGTLGRAGPAGKADEGGREGAFIPRTSVMGR